MNRHVDVLIIGSGIAGLCTAIKIALLDSSKKILIVTKASKSESNTKYAQGGIASVFDKFDSFEKHIQDTLIAGDNLNDLQVVEKVISNGPKCLKEITSWGVEFDKTINDTFELGKEGGHSNNRIIHYKDVTGLEIERKLLKKAEKLEAIEILQYHFVIDLITNHQVKKITSNICYGVYIISEKTNQVFHCTSSKVCISMGGIGQVYKHTTNPKIATGDGIAMAYRAKAKITGMEFIQFHPTALYEPNVSPSFLISEAVRGFGGVLRNRKKERFMSKYDKRLELAPRDIVSRAIDHELKTSGERFIYLDVTNTDLKSFKSSFPNIYQKCVSNGIDVSKEYIPVVYTMHYVCGGVSVDLRGRTSISNLYACGESAFTGLHGANRLASNSLLEAIVYSDFIARDIIDSFDSIEIKVPKWDDSGTISPNEKILITQNKEEVQTLMNNYVAIVRSNERLNQALKRLDIIYKETELFYKKSKLSVPLCELRNLVTIAYLIVKQSLERKENKGVFYNKDLVNR